MTTLPEGAPVSSAQLKTLGVTPQLARRYVEGGWLKPLARGVFERVGDALELHPSLRWLETRVAGLHVGGKSALDWYGIRQYVYARPVITLYGTARFRVPDWFHQRFPARYRVKRLFDEGSGADMGVSRFGQPETGPLVSEPERAFLEMLSEVGVRQTLDEASELASHTHTLRGDTLQQLLEACRSVKTVRLALKLGRDADMPWFKRLERGRLPTGSTSRWVMRSGHGLLVLDP